MDVVLDSTQALLMENVRRYLANEFDLRRAGPENVFDEHVWGGLKELGCFELGENSADRSGLVANATAVIYELGYGAINSPYIASAVLLPYACLGSDDVWAQLSPGWADGGIVAAAVDRRGAVLPWGDAAQHVLAVDEAERVLLCPMATRDVRKPTHSQCEPLASVGWDAGAATIIATGDAAARLARDLRALQRLALAAFMTGAAEHAMMLAATYAGERVQFGRPIGTFQAIQAKCADMEIGVHAARLLVFDTCDLLARGTPAEAEALGAAVFAARTLRSVAGEALQVHGGIGLVENHPIQRFYRMGVYYPATYANRLDALLEVANLPVGQLE
jgi:alkylation response protein AidB-like acyl-CoA dehydrogenase